MKTLDPIDQYFPKGDKRRGQALVVNAFGHIEGRKEREAEIIEIFRSWYQMYRSKFPLRFEAEVTK